jgi:hypothetical protein
MQGGGGGVSCRFDGVLMEPLSACHGWSDVCTYVTLRYTASPTDY